MLAFNMERRGRFSEGADVDCMEKESKMYVILESMGVPNITPFGKGNDVSAPPML